jgi:hypothetical protein
MAITPGTHTSTPASATVARGGTSRRTLVVLVILLAAFGALLPRLGTAEQHDAVTDSGPAGLTGVVREEIGTGIAQAATATVTREIQSACRDRGYSLDKWKVTSTYRWHYNSTGAPKTVASTAVRALTNATGTITRGTNNCGIRASLTSKQSYRGKIARRAQIGSDGTCTGNDGYSVASWMRMSSGALAITCTYYAKGKVVASDVVINTKYAWFTTTPKGCRYSFDLQSVMTHERGHTFGLGHVSPNSHSGQTMTTTVPPCNITKRTLGGGDMAGLIRLYRS